MPTGYTAALYDGPQSFEEFFWRCTRAMGLFIHMRDDSLNAPLPEKFEARDSYHHDSLKNSSARLARVMAMTDAQCDLEASREYKASLREHNKAAAEKDARAARFQEMTERVMAWKPVQGFDGLKKFMLDQLATEAPYLEPSEPPEKMTGPEWRRQQIESAEWDIDYCSKQIEEERKRIEESNRSLAALRASVPPPRSTKSSAV